MILIIYVFNLCETNIRNLDAQTLNAETDKNYFVQLEMCMTIVKLKSWNKTAFNVK